MLVLICAKIWQCKYLTLSHLVTHSMLAGFKKLSNHGDEERYEMERSDNEETQLPDTQIYVAPGAADGAAAGANANASAENIMPAIPMQAVPVYDQGIVKSEYGGQKMPEDPAKKRTWNYCTDPTQKDNCPFN
jgi:hypothetical protein